MDIPTAVEKFLDQLAADGRSLHTRRQYARHLRLLSDWAAGEGIARDITRLDHEAVARFLAAPVARTRAGGGEKRATAMNCLRSSVRGFCLYLHRAGYLAENPARLVRSARCAPPPPRGLSDAERARLLEALDGGEGDAARRDRIMIRLLLETGIRLASALALNVEDVGLERGEVTLRTTKNDRPAVVYLPESMRRELAEFIGLRTAGPLFAARQGGRVSGRHVQRRLAAVFEAAGCRNASPHRLRHDFATRLYARTGDVLLVKEALHHRSIVSTLVYAHAGEARLRAALG